MNASLDLRTGKDGPSPMAVRRRPDHRLAGADRVPCPPQGPIARIALFRALPDLVRAIVFLIGGDSGDHGCQDWLRQPLLRRSRGGNRTQPATRAVDHPGLVSGGIRSWVFPVCEPSFTGTPLFALANPRSGSRPSIGLRQEGLGSSRARPGAEERRYALG